MTLWILGGLDPTGGAGLLRDHWTAQSLGFKSTHAVVTALTEQGRGPVRAWPVAPSDLAGRLSEAPTPSAIKIGLVPAGLGPTLIAALDPIAVPVVLDPVLAASHGGALGSSVEALRGLAARCTLITPNLPEAQALAGEGAPDDPGALARQLADALGAPALLVKGGHAGGPDVCDWLAHGGSVGPFQRPRVPGPDVRGTGCALATAIAVGLARGEGLEVAVGRAIAWLDGARGSARPGRDGRPHLP